MKNAGNDPNPRQTRDEIEELRRRVEEAEDALRAIRDGEVDAIVVSGNKGERIYSLAETENLHRLMVEAMNEVGIATSPEGIILFCNRRATAVLQRSAGELLGMPLQEFVAAHQAARMSALLRNAEGESGERVIFIAKDGSALPMQVWASRVESNDGLIVSLVATDLTRVEADGALLDNLREQQQALRLREQELTVASARLSADLDAMSRLQRVAGMFVRGEDTQSLLNEMLEAAIALSGGFSGDLQLIHPNTGIPYIVAERGFEPWRLEFWEQHLEMASCCGLVWEHGRQQVIEDVDNDPLFADTPALDAHRRAGVRSVISTPLVGWSGEVIGVLTTHSSSPGKPDARTRGWLDLLARETSAILGRLDTETTLRRRQEELEALFTESPAAILMAHDVACAQITRNNEAALLFGHGDGARDVERKLLQRAITAARPYREVEMEVVRDDGSTIAVTGGATPLFDATGAVRGAVAVFNNITAQRRVQEDLRKAVVRSDRLVKELENAQRELKKSHLDLEEMVKQRTQLSEERGEKLRVMATALSSAEQDERRRLAQVLHDDLQQMLVAIRLRLSSLETVVVGTELGPTVSGINDIVDNAITASRSLTMELSPPILREPLPRVIEWLARWFETRHGLVVELDIEPDIREPTDEAKKFLFQAVRELLMNVRKHAGTDTARISVTSPTDEVMIEVRDDGKGFETDQSAQNDQTAFGLDSIRERVEMLGGHFEIRSANGKGTSCIIGMPAQIPYVTQPEAQKSGAETKPVRILVVDDHTIFRRGLISILESYPDLRVVGEASDGEEGVAKAAGLLPDVVIMDLAMPRMNGIEATRIIKSRFMSIDVLALSFQESEHARTSVLDAGASNYFTKSGPLDALLRAIRSRTGGDGGGAPSGDGDRTSRADKSTEEARADGRPANSAPGPDGNPATGTSASPALRSKPRGRVARQRRA